MKMTSAQFVKSISKDIPSGTSIRVRHPYTEATFEFDSLPEETFLYLKQHADCVDSNFDHSQYGFVIDAKMTFKCVGEETYYEVI
jgi:hypothetical protein